VQEAMNNVVVANNQKIAAVDFATATEPRPTAKSGLRLSRLKVKDRRLFYRPKAIGSLKSWWRKVKPRP